jgi:hypothetical protein
MQTETLSPAAPSADGDFFAQHAPTVQPHSDAGKAADAEFRALESTLTEATAAVAKLEAEPIINWDATHRRKIVKARDEVIDTLRAMLKNRQAYISGGLEADCNAADDAEREARPNYAQQFAELKEKLLARMIEDEWPPLVAEALLVGGKAVGIPCGPGHQRLVELRSFHERQQREVNRVGRMSAGQRLRCRVEADSGRIENDLRRALATATAPTK